MKSRIFLASSTQASDRMGEIAGWLTEWEADPIPWNQPGLFKAGDFILERLLEISRDVDAALILFGEEDRGWYHEDAQPQPRDNVLIEYGIFASQLGHKRVGVCRFGNPKQASDLGGLIVLEFGDSEAKKADARERLRLWVLDLPKLIAAAREAQDARRAQANMPVPSVLDATYHVPGDPGRKVFIQTGSLKDVRNVDVVVSSENTDLQPARFYDRAMSGTLRYLDAEKNNFSGRVRRDVYLEGLTDVIRQEGVELPVLPGSVVPVATHSLQTQGVKFVFHAAVVEGKVGQGYVAVDTAIDDAVRQSFERFAEVHVDQQLQSILFPMFGAGSGAMSEAAAARRIVQAIAMQLPRFPQPTSIYLYALIEAHRLAFRNAADAVGWVPA